MLPGKRKVKCPPDCLCHVTYVDVGPEVLVPLLVLIDEASIQFGLTGIGNPNPWGPKAYGCKVRPAAESSAQQFACDLAQSVGVLRPQWMMFIYGDIIRPCAPGAEGKAKG